MGARLRLQSDISSPSPEFVQAIRGFLKTLAPLPEEEILRIAQHVRPRSLAVGEHFTQAGECTDEVALVISGLVKKYYLSEEGEERIKGFGMRGQLIGAYADLLRGEAARFSIEALKPTELAVMQFSAFRGFYGVHPAWQEFGRRVAEGLFIERETREFEFLTLSAEERYRVFREQLGTLEKEIPQKLIASYLGIHPVSLSRIRSRRR